MTKKITAIILAIVMAFSASVMVFAADESEVPDIDKFVSAIKSDVSSFKGSIKMIKSLSRELRKEITPYMMDVVLTSENIETVMGLMAKLVNKVKNSAHKHEFLIEDMSEAALRTPATCINDAVYYKSCACGAISSSKDDVFTVSGSHNTAPHSFTSYSNDLECWGICVLCGYESEHTATVKPCEKWKSDATYHWHIDGDEKVDNGIHEYVLSSEKISESEEKLISTCKVCGYSFYTIRYDCQGDHDFQPIIGKENMIKAPSKKNHTDAVYCYSCSRCGQTDPDKHTFSAHEYIYHSNDKECWAVCKYCEEETQKTPLSMPSEKWLSNSNTHWHESPDGKVDVGVHIESDWIIDQEPTTTEKGTMHKECTVCAYVLETAEATTTVGDLTDMLSKYIFVKVEDVDASTMDVLEDVEYKTVTLDDGSCTVYIAVNIVDNPDLFNYEVFRNVVEDLYAEQGEELIKGEDGQIDYLMSYEHIAGELAFHAVIYALMNELIGYTGTTNSTIVALYLSAAIADLNVDESRVPSSFLSILGVLLVDMLQFRVLKLFGKL